MSFTGLAIDAELDVDSLFEPCNSRTSRPMQLEGSCKDFQSFLVMKSLWL